MKLRRTMRLLAGLVVIMLWLAVVASAWSNHISPMRSAIAPLAYMVFPIILIIGLILVPVTFFWSRKLAGVGVVLLACCLPQALTFCPLHFSRTVVDESVSTDTFSVMTFNGYYFNSYINVSRDSIAADEAVIAILNADPDIVVLQEVFTFDPFAIGRKKVSPALSAQVRAFYPYREFTSNALAIMSKYPFRSVPLPNYNPTGEQSFEVQRVEVQIGDSLLNIFNVHLQSLYFSPAELGIVSRIAGGEARHIADARGAIMNKIRYAFRNRAIQAQTVRRLVDSITTQPLVICGDFNDVPGCWAVREIKGGDLTDAFAASGFGPSVTYRKHNLYYRIDQMLCSKSLKPLGSEVLAAGESDHYPIFTLFTFRNNR